MTSKQAYLNLGYTEVRATDKACFLVREYATGQYCGQLLTGGKSYVLQSVDIARLHNQEDIPMSKYTRENLEAKTGKELLAIYNKATNSNLKKFQNKKDAVERTLTVVNKGSRHNVMDDIRAAIEDGPVTITSLAEKFDISPNTVRTKLTRLKSPKYCGNGKPLKIMRDGDTYSCA